ncbi:MAG: biotin--[acetyl-CoA-carboxylase] ligase [Deltaproteobacteria bacterium]|nr:biotin--[acetyl-CoA-carboxylase] ligase [Deltaproteobacteria bacterium]
MSAAALPLRTDDIAPHLETVRLGRRLHCFDLLDSTNTRARELAEAGAAEGTAVIADRQSRGRGRLGRSWSSPPALNLYLSLILRPPLPPMAAPQITLVLGLAAAQAVREWTPEVSIKWPNDLVSRGRKLAGILTEMATDEDRIRFVIAGIGVNLNGEAGDFPPELRDSAISLRSVTGASVDRGRFAARLLHHLELRYDEFVRDGFAAIAPCWQAYSGLTGAAIVVQSQSGDMSERITGTVLGLADDGSLRLRQADGSERRIVAGEVTVVGGYGVAGGSS